MAKKAKPKAKSTKKITTKNAKPIESLWEKHWPAIERSGLKTIKELASSLKESHGNESGVKGIPRAQAADLLIDIALHAVPLGFQFKDRLGKKFEGNPEKVNFPAIVSELKKALEEEAVDNETKTVFADVFSRMDSNKIQDPLEAPIELKHYQPTERILQNKIVREIAVRHGFPPDKADALAKKYTTPNALLLADPQAISLSIGSDLNGVQIVLVSACWWQGRDVAGIGISAVLAVALGKASLTAQNAIVLKPDELKEKIKITRMPVPPEETTDEKLQGLIDSARKAFPDAAYFKDVVSLLGVSDEIRNALEDKRIDTFKKLLKTGFIEKKLLEGGQNAKLARSLLSYARLAKVTRNAALAKALQDDGIDSVFKLSRISRQDFIEKYKNKEKEDELVRVHRQAVAISGKNMPVAEWANLLARNLGVDRMLPGNAEAREAARKMMKGAIP